MALEFDYVIVGAGAAGSVLANRLSEDGKATVCVLEAGPPDLNPYIHIPAGYIKTLFDPAYTWQFRTEPTERTGGRAIGTTQGRTLGGGSSVNGCVYNRGQPADFDGWAQRGNRGWSWQDVLPYFRRSVSRIGVTGEEHGGPVTVSPMDWMHPVSAAFIKGCISSGIPFNGDYNNGHQAGVGYFQRTISKGLRVSAARAFLHPAAKRPNVEVLTSARASEILFEGSRAVGVAYLRKRGGARQEIRARREVLICSGTVNSARLLQVSGVGPGGLLSELGRPVVVERKGVGANFRDHYAVRAVMRAKPGTVTLNELSRGVRLGGQIARWALKRPNILATSPSQVFVFWKTFAGLDSPDIQCVFTPGSYAQGKVYVLDDYPGVTAGLWPHRPESTGFVHARSTDVFDDPTIQPNYLAAEADKRVTIAGLRFVRRLLATPELAEFVTTETLPGPEVQSDEDLLAFAYANGSTAFHLIGTCRMGPSSDPEAVVDDQLRVHNTEGLRVVDASIMPSMPSANTYATTLMIAEKAADLVRAAGYPGAAAAPSSQPGRPHPPLTGF